MSNVYFTKDGANQSLVLSSNSTNSSIGYGGSITTPVTINSTAGVQFCNVNGANVGVSISSAGVSSNGLNVTGPISCSSLIIPTSSGSINSLGAITITTPILTCNGLTSTATGPITGINTLITSGLTCTGAITGVTAITGTTSSSPTQTCSISGVTSLTLTGGVTMNGSISNVTTLSCPTINAVNTLTTGTLNLQNSLSCNNGISFTGITNNGSITGINILTASGDVNCNNLIYNNLQIIGSSGSVTGISSLSANGLLTLSGTSASAGNLYVSSGFKCAYDGAITRVSTLSTGTLTITGTNSSIYIGSTYKLPYNSSNDISCNSLTTTTGAFSCTSPITITTAGVISNVTSLNMSGNLTCIDLSCNNFKVSSFGVINSGNINTNLEATTCSAGAITISGTTGLTTSTSVSSTISATTINASNNITFSGNLNINSIPLFNSAGTHISSAMTLDNAVASTITSVNIAGWGNNNFKMIKIGTIYASPQSGTISFTSGDLNGSTNVIVCCSVNECPDDAAIANIFIYPNNAGTIQTGNNTTQFLNGFSYKKYNMNPYMSTTLNGATSGGDVVTTYAYIAIGW